MPLNRFFRRDPQQIAARVLYDRIVSQARHPAFYTDYGVPDSLDGRFDLIVLHCFLVLHRLKRNGRESEDAAQSLIDTLFLDMDSSLRELGVGDLGVSRRVKRMAEGFYGRISAYETGLSDTAHGVGDAVGGMLEAALARNLYGTVDSDHQRLMGQFAEQIAAMAAYTRRAVDTLAEQELESLIAGKIEFETPPTLQAPVPLRD